MSTLRPLLSKQTPHHTQSHHEDIHQRQQLRSILNDIVAGRLHNGSIQHKTIKCWNHVPIDQTYQPQEHRYSQQNVLPEEIMTGFHRVVVIVPEHVHEGKKTTIYPSPSLNHQLLMGFHWVCVGNGIRHIPEDIVPVLLAIYPQTQYSILCQIHVGFPVIPLFMAGIKNHFEVLSL